ncbi:DNA repair REV1 [Micractinium conductrix]|uniref:DNA polymerase kappa n=1 Tax=Micractinium conductrix TaxID=554055 RepID=A0A2P6VBM3_9CHLO|nr:DNA repair REV1 [Micractinium conductrix]|eukprot:PSC71461.1 DNA repair REV1 [Micractinium conductrix]
MSGRGPLGARLPPPTGDQHKRRLPDGSESQYHGGSFASYMSGKINKLEEQFAANQAGQQKSELFAGVGIHVNGLTTPSHLELKQLMAVHGGRFHNYYETKKVTHIVCANLPDFKVKEYERARQPCPVVRPEWIVDSIAAGQRLPIQAYTLWQLRDAPGQQKLKAFQPVGGAMLPPGAIFGEQAGTVGAAAELAPGTTACGTAAAGAGVALPPVAGGAPLMPPPPPAQPPSPPLPPQAARPLSPASAAAAAAGAAAGYDPAEMRQAQQLASRLRSECEGLRGPPRTSREDPNFVDTFFKNSRLHFIGSWKQRIEALMALPAASEGPAPRQPGPGSPRSIIHLDLDCFFAAVAEQEHPIFKGKPVAVSHSASASGTGEVSTCNYEARKYGIKSGMFISQAKELCPHLVVVPYMFEQYETVSEKAYRILLRHTSCLQPLSCDEAFMDVTGLGDPQQIAAAMRAEIFAATGCTASAGIAPNLLLARIASGRAKPNGQLAVAAGEEARSFLQGLPVDDLPGVGWSTRQQLAAKGIATVADLQVRSRAFLQGLLGPKQGAMLWDFAAGIDKRQVEPVRARKSVGAECNYALRFQDLEDAHKVLNDLAAEVQERLRRAGVRGRTITLKLMKRKAGVGEPLKFMGHGICDNLSRSVTLARYTDAAADISRECRAVLAVLRVPPQDIRGMGIQVTRLDNEGAARGGGAQAGQLKAMFQRQAEQQAAEQQQAEQHVAKQQALLAAMQEAEQQAVAEQHTVAEQRQQHEQQHASSSQSPGEAAARAVPSQRTPRSASKRAPPKQATLEQALLRSRQEQAGAAGPAAALAERRQLVQQFQGTSLSQMDASVLERLPWSVQKELIEGLPGGRGQQEQGPGLPAAEQLAARFASGAGGEGGSRAAAAAPCAAPGRHRRQLSNDEEEWEPDWAPASPSEEQAEQQQQQQQQQQRDGASGSGRGDAGSPIVALPAFSQIDTAVLDALPLAMRRELEAAYGISRPAKRQPPAVPASRRGGQGGSHQGVPLHRPQPVPKRQRIDAFISHAPPPPQRQQQAQQAAGLLSLSQVDPAVLQELPAEVRREVLQQLQPGGRPHGSRALPRSRLGQQQRETEAAWQQRWQEEQQLREAETADAVGSMLVDGASQQWAGGGAALLQQEEQPQEAAVLPPAVQRFVVEAGSAASAQSLAAALAGCLEQLEAQLAADSAQQQQQQQQPEAAADTGGEGSGGGSDDAEGGSAAELQFAGPYLRYNGGCSPTAPTEWTGSVLIVTKQDAANGGGAGGGAPALTLVDSLRDADAAVAPDETSVLSAPTKLDECNGWTFWRFELSFELAIFQRSVQYGVTLPGGASVPTYTFWLPAVGQPMHWGYYSCNGFSGDVGLDKPERADPCYLWRDLLSLHSAFPMHCLVGGGDQLYNDMVFLPGGAASLKVWGDQPKHTDKVAAPWTDEMQRDSTEAYLNNYLTSFMIKEVQQAFSTIPQVMMWDDHDLWDGYGSYDEDMQNCPVFKNLFAVARRFYLLFQHHTNDAFNATAKEFLGSNDGSELHYLKYLGPQVVLLGVDMRSRRTRARIMPDSAYQLLEEAVMAMPSGPQHIVVMCGCPLIFPSIPIAEGLLTAIAAGTKSSAWFRGMMRKTGLLDRFDQPEILDDLVDGWAADMHKQERLQFICLLQKFAESKCLRVTILSGDAHVGGVGRLYSREKISHLGEDPLYMPQIISSAIMNAPPGHAIVRMLLRTNRATNVDERTRQKMCRTFYPMHPRTDKLISARNWCNVCMVAPPYSHPTVPNDPDFGGLRFTLRVEDVDHRRGYADECYTVLVPRHPAASETLISTGVTAVKPAGVLPTASTATAGADGNTVPFNLASQLALPRRATTAAEA